MTFQEITEIKEGRGKMADFEKELSNLQVEISQSRAKTEEMITVLNDRADSVEFQFGCLTDRLAAIEAENKSLKSDIIDLKSRSMTDNLIFLTYRRKRMKFPMSRKTFYVNF